MQVYQPEFWLPLIGRPAWLAQLTSRARLNQAWQRLRDCGCAKVVLYIWRPDFADALEQAPHYDLSIYHVDDEYSFSPTQVEITPAERHLLEASGQVFIHSPSLMERKGGINPNSQFLPNGAEYQLYATPAPEPEDLASIPHPRIGYMGYLKQMLDWVLLLELSARHREWSFVFVGSCRPHAEMADALREITRRPNVYLLGGKPVERLGGYPQHFDVCIMPYRLDDYTNCIYPLKMHEYLASGQPVVSSPVRSVLEFRNVIALARSGEEWSKAITYALSPQENSAERRAERQAVARIYDWDTLVAKIAGVIAQRIGVAVPGDVQSRLEATSGSPVAAASRFNSRSWTK
jgi:glycosyltransferase involved in cell wall biosynthesis